jgi:hypothetical protein
MADSVTAVKNNAVSRRRHGLLTVLAADRIAKGEAYSHEAAREHQDSDGWRLRGQPLVKCIHKCEAKNSGTGQ